MRIVYSSLVFVSLILLSSCFKEEDPVVLPPARATITTLSMGANYDKQLYFELNTNTYSEKKLEDWDVAFEANSNGYHLILNYGKEIFASVIDNYYIDSIRMSDINGITWKYDDPGGDLSKTAIGDWVHGSPNKKSKVFIIDLGIGYSQDKRYKKMQVTDFNDSVYKIKYGDINDERCTYLHLDKRQEFNFVYFSFKNSGAVLDTIEPHKQYWDLLFTKYRHVFYNIGPDPFPYMVTGVLINPYKVKVAVDSTTSFDDISYPSCINAFQYSSKKDIIGYNWKEFDLSGTLTYSIKSNYNYIIIDTKGDYYKLKFIDFYDKNKVKGYPKFEFKKLN